MNKQTVADVENGRPTVRPATLMKLRGVLVSLGIAFIDDDQGIGVRRRRTLDELQAFEAARRSRELTAERERGPLTPAECRAARGLLGWTAARLSEATSISTTSLREFEAGNRRLHPRNLQAIEAALKTEGVDLVVGGGGGVRLR
jgi:transcriptional regulator with XRE-family HTH domain